MRNKKLLQNRLSTLQGQLKTLDMQIHRGGSREGINEAQRSVTETVQDDDGNDASRKVSGSPSKPQTVGNIKHIDF